MNSVNAVLPINGTHIRLQKLKSTTVTAQVTQGQTANPKPFLVILRRTLLFFN